MCGQSLVHVNLVAMKGFYSTQMSSTLTASMIFIQGKFPQTVEILYCQKFVIWTEKNRGEGEWSNTRVNVMCVWCGGPHNTQTHVHCVLGWARKINPWPPPLTCNCVTTFPRLYKACTVHCTTFHLTKYLGHGNFFPSGRQGWPPNEADKVVAWQRIANCKLALSSSYPTITLNENYYELIQPQLVAFEELFSISYLMSNSMYFQRCSLSLCECREREEWTSRRRRRGWGWRCLISLTSWS